MKRLALILALTTALPAHAGGPVVLEDPEVTAPAKRPCLIGCLAAGIIVVGAIAILAGNDDTCFGPDPEAPPTPTGGC